MQFRIDDIGASSKQFEQHGKSLFSYRGIPYFYWPLANVGFFKRIPPFRRWGPYPELTADEWLSFLQVFRKHRIVPIVAVTACWVDEKSRLMPFPEKYPDEAGVLKKAFIRGEIVVANHGLTHCVPGKHLPKFRASNRSQHREFWPDLPPEYHSDHVLRSQKILESFFEQPITVFVPPGNVWSVKTYWALKNTSITTVQSHRYMLDTKEPMAGIEFVSDRKNFYLCHDRELKLLGPAWLERTIRNNYPVQ